MEVTTPPNTSGFNRKPRNRKRISSRKLSSRKPAVNPFVGMSEDTQAWFFGSMFLMAAARLLAPFIGFETPTDRPTETTNG